MLKQVKAGRVCVFKYKQRAGYLSGRKVAVVALTGGLDEAALTSAQCALNALSKFEEMDDRFTGDCETGDCD